MQKSTTNDGTPPINLYAIQTDASNKYDVRQQDDQMV